MFATAVAALAITSSAAVSLAAVAYKCKAIIACAAVT
jgi:hypothetical protein